MPRPSSPGWHVTHAPSDLRSLVCEFKDSVLWFLFLFTTKIINGSRFSGLYLGLARSFQPRDSHLPGHWLEPVPGLLPGEGLQQSSVLRGAFSVPGQEQCSSFLPAPRARPLLGASASPACSPRTASTSSIDRENRGLEYSYLFLILITCLVLRFVCF